ncbi:sugar phosphate isomerase/epimerase [Ureibacillus composti]|nr:sugar phosphate isomerase/epimerase [Ureibacillus composti]
MNSIFLVANSFGVDHVKENGHQAYLPAIRSSGAKGLEVRRELLKFEQAELSNLREALKSHSLACIYSTPIELWNEQFEFNEFEFFTALMEAKLLGAQLVKFSLGHYDENQCDLESIKLAFEDEQFPTQLKITIENTQKQPAGDLEKILTFLMKCDEANIPIKFTFDIGNWVWNKIDPDEAASKLKDYVEYVHIKDVDCTTTPPTVQPLRPPSENELDLKRILKHFRSDLPVGFEFPIGEPTTPPSGLDMISKINGYVNLFKRYV